MVTFQISIDGMHCGSCVEKIEKALVATPSVSECRVMLAEKRAVVTFQNDQPDLAEAVEAIQGQGFTVTGYQEAAVDGRS